MTTTTAMHPIIAQLAEELMPLVDEKAPARPTRADRTALMTVRKKIKNLPDADREQIGDAGRTDLHFLYVKATQEANRQEEFFENNGNKFAD